MDLEYTTDDQAPALDSLDDAVNYAEWIVDSIANHVSGAVLEIGAGTGTMADRLRHLGQLTSTEPDPSFAKRLDERLRDEGVIVVNCDWATATATGVYQSIVAVNVLEHIEDDRAALKQARNALRPGGTISIFVPAFQILFSQFDADIGHYRRYRKPDLVKLTEEVGLEIVSAKYMNSVGWFAWLVIARVLGRAPAVGAKVALYDKVAIPVLRRIESIVAPPFGQSLLLVARRPD